MPWTYLSVIVTCWIEKILENNFEKKSSKTKKNFGVITRDWKTGDYVKVLEYDITGLPITSYGIIMNVNEYHQLSLFPSCDVYVAGHGLVSGVHLYSLEIISAAS